MLKRTMLNAKGALAEHVDKLLDHAEAAGWDRVKAASAMMYLSAKLLDPNIDKTR